jgi:hypothetical protein
MSDVRFEVFMAVKMQVEVFWVVMPCSYAAGYQCFRKPCCLHLYTEDGRQKGSSMMIMNGE